MVEEPAEDMDMDHQEDMDMVSNTDIVSSSFSTTIQ